MTMSRSTERVVAGHQPHYCPWLGYVDKIGSVDVFCQIDVIPFEEQLFQHRNRIRAGNAAGEEWLVVPLVVVLGPHDPSSFRGVAPVRRSRRSMATSQYRGSMSMP